MLDQLARQSRSTPLVLASVRSVREARFCLNAGVDLIDCKEPDKGALGALDVGIVSDIVDLVGGAVPVSATVGDLPCQPEPITAAVCGMARSGANIVKIGVLPGGTPLEVIAGLKKLDIGSARLVAVLFADLAPDLDLIPHLAKAGFAGVMLDTAEKTSGALTDVLEANDLERFVMCAHAHGLFAGLAGALRMQHIDPVCAAGPDVVGFRGALCAANARGGALDPHALDDVLTAVRASRAAIAPLANV